MSHVDEGALHAYLDGALAEYPVAEARRIREHLDLCAECAERLEVERALRSDAHAMLGLAAPAVDLPSFEELRAYVERTRPAPSRVTARITRLSWAASVMLALGVGWTLRGGRLEPSADLSSLAPALEAEQTGAVMGRGGVRENSPVSLADATVETARAAEAGPTEAIEADAFESRADLPGRAVAKTEADEEDADIVVPAERAVTSEQPVATVSTAGLVAAEPPAGSMLRQAALDEVVAGGGAVSDATAGAADDTASLRRAEAEVVADAAAASAEAPTAEEARLERRRAESPTAFTSQFNAGRGSVRVVPEDDDRFEDEPLQSVPGFEVLATDNIGDGTVFLGTVATQRLEGTDVMEVFLLEPEVELDVLPPLDPSVNEVRVQAETGWVVLRGPRSEDELETLLMRLFPG